jgi:hypothetical protein
MVSKEDKEKLVKILKNDLCSCGQVGEEMHTCPFGEEIHYDTTTLCNCCGDCEYDCALAI